ncbi:MAG: peptide chain release factor N(5)-glutamine methyltransferase [Ruminococcaceae bacterium]|nr:peptide chain release factor N(5)-glutamine methyltransferase [Oscillospiraceae bacterium]
MTISQAKLQITQITNDTHSADMILGHLLKVPRSYLFIHTNRPLTELQESKLSEYLRRLAANEPIQYILGYADFMNIRVKVTQDVLIPRSDTETLASFAIDAIKAHGYTNMLDMCCGSGCIALSVLHEIPDKKLKAICADISPAALKIASENAASLGEKRVSFVETNYFSKFIPSSDTFDIIVSNPPYIEKNDIPDLMPQVRDFEPHLALDGGEDGLDAYRILISDAPKHLCQGGILAFEVGYNQAAQVATLMERNFKNIEILKDLSGIDRVVKGEK